MSFDSRHQPHPDYPFFLFDPEGEGITFYRTAEDRDAAAKGAIQEYLADGSWAEEVTGLCAGHVTHIATETNRRDRPPDDELDEEGCDGEGVYWEPEHGWTCNYELLPLGTTPTEGNGGANA